MQDDDDEDDSDDETMPYTYSPIDLTDGVRSGSAGVGIDAAAGLSRFEFDFGADRRHSDHLSASSCRRVQTEIMVRTIEGAKLVRERVGEPTVYYIDLQHFKC